MLRNYFKIAIRSLAKNKSYVIINTLGMGTAIACCILAYLSFEYNDEFDHGHKNLDEIYQVVTIRDMNNTGQPFAIAPAKLAELAGDQLAGVSSVIRVIPEWGNVKRADNTIWTNFFFVDNDFFNVFTLPLVRGDANAIRDPQNIFITEETAEKIFGNEDPMGKTIERYVNDEPHSFTVAGILGELPPNSSFAFMQSVINIENYKTLHRDFINEPWNYWIPVFMRIQDPASIPGIEEMFDGLVVEPHNSIQKDTKIVGIDLQPLDGMADRAENSNVWNYWFDHAVPAAAIVGPAIMAALLMLLSCFNYTNTSIAMSGRRLKEIGLRKVMGGLRKQLIFQFIIENIVMCLIALLVGIMIAELLIPYYNSMWDFLVLDLSYSNNVDLILFLLGLLLLVGLVAGSYPSIFLSRFEATPILRGTVKFGGNTPTSRVLLVLQLSISLMAIVAAFSFMNNAKFQQEFDLGFNQDQLVYTFIDNGQEYEKMRNELLKYDEIKTISGTQNHFLSSISLIRIVQDDEEYELDLYRVGHDYFDVMEVEVVEGRTFMEDSESDRKESVIANQMFIDQQGITDPIGHKLSLTDTTTLYIVGVVENTYTNALWGPVEPALFRLADKENYSRILVTAEPEDIQLAHEHLGEVYSSLFPNRLYNGVYGDDDLAEGVLVNKNIVIIFAFLGLVALTLSVSGLYAMISLIILKRTKEIGVRKVLGASVKSIIAKLNAPFVVMVLMSLVLGSAAAYFLVDSLMEMIFTIYQKPGVQPILVGSILLFVIAIATVTGRVLKAALVNPVKSLRNE